MLSQRQRQHQAQLDRIHPVRYLSVSAQLILSDATSTSVGILLTAWSSPPHPKLPANSRPVCYRQETDFCLRAGRVSEESTESSAGAQAFSKTQPGTYTASHCPRGLCYAAELCIEAARDCLGTERVYSHGHGRSLCAVLLREAPGQTAATSEVPSQQPLTSPTIPHQGRALDHPVTLLIEPLSPFSLRNQAEDDKSCWCHHQLLAVIPLWTL